jgi:hypothetical protein
MPGIEDILDDPHEVDEDENDLHPFVIHEGDDTDHSLTLSDFTNERNESLLERTGYASSSGWQLIAQRVCSDLKLKDIEFDSESERFVAVSDDLAQLEMLGTRLARLYRSPNMLRKAIERSPKNWR